MRLQVLHVPECPHAALLIARIAEVLTGGVQLERHVVRDPREASSLGMCGSPTLLIDGADPFAVGDQRPSLSCRLFRDESGLPTEAPTLGQLRRVLATARIGGT